MLISIEGIDGAGKNTLVSKIKEAMDRPVEVMAFPRYGESIHAQLAQRALYGKMGDLTDSSYAMATLFALDRLGAKDRLQQAKRADTVVLLDRYIASNAAYSAARLEDDAVMSWGSRRATRHWELPQADLRVYLDKSVRVAQERAKARAHADASRERDRYERDGGLQERTAAAYRRLAERNWGGRWIATADADTIISAIKDLVGE